MSLKIIFATLLLTILGIADRNANAAGACFNSTSTNSLVSPSINFSSFQFVSNAPPPWSTNGNLAANSAYYPATNFSTANSSGLKYPAPAGSGLTEGYWLWGNRCAQIDGVTPVSISALSTNSSLWPYSCKNVTVSKGNDDYQNPIPIVDGAGNLILDSAGNEVLLRPMFSTYMTSNICTVAQGMALTGQYNGANIGQLQAWINSQLSNFSMYPLKLTAIGNVLPASPSPLTSPIPAAYLQAISTLENLKSTVTVAGASQTYLVDVCIVPQPPNNILSTSNNLVLDYEVQDSRPIDAITHLLQNVKSLLAGSQKLFVFTNDFSSGGPKNGITATTIATVLANTDYLSPIIWTGATSGGAATSQLSQKSFQFTLASNFGKQIATVDPRGILSLNQRAQFVPFVSLYYDTCPSTNANGGQCSATGSNGYLADYQLLRQKLQDFGYGGLGIWRNGEPQMGNQSCSATAPDGTAVNQIIACLAFGKCDGQYNGGL